VFDFGKVILNHIGPEMEALWRSGNKDAVDEAVKKQLVSTETPTTVRWGIEQGLWSFNLPSPTDWVTETQKYTLDAVVDGIQCPVFVGDGESEHFFPGEAKQLAARLGDRATYHQFKNVDGAGDHCQVGATQLMNQVVFDWFHQLISKD
jgi:hypothetical protein